MNTLWLVENHLTVFFCLLVLYLGNCLQAQRKVLSG